MPAVPSLCPAARSRGGAKPTPQIIPRPSHKDSTGRLTGHRSRGLSSSRTAARAQGLHRPDPEFPHGDPSFPWPHVPVSPSKQKPRFLTPRRAGRVSERKSYSQHCDGTGQRQVIQAHGPNPQRSQETGPRWRGSYRKRQGPRVGPHLPAQGSLLLSTVSFCGRILLIPVLSSPGNRQL